MDEQEFLDLYEKYVKQYEKRAKKAEEKIERINETRKKINETYDEHLPMIESNIKGKLDYEDFKETILEEFQFNKDKDINNKTDRSIIVSDLAREQTKFGASWGKGSSFTIASAIWQSIKDILQNEDGGILYDAIINADIYDKNGRLNYFKLASAIANGKIDVLALYNSYLKNVLGIKDSSQRAERIRSDLFYGS